MPTVNYYLKKAEKGSGKSLICLRFNYNGRRLVFTFGQSVDSGSWSSKKQRLKQKSATTADGKYLLNDLLDNLKKLCETAYNSEIKSGIPEPATLKKYLIDYMNQNSSDPKRPTLKGLIDRFIKNEIKYKGRDKNKNTIKTYNTVLGHLDEYEQKERLKVDFEGINLDFYYKYVSFLKLKKLSQNSIAKDIQILKVFMSEAVDLGYTSNLQFKHKKFSVAREESDSVYLTEPEIIKLYKHDLTEHKRLEQARDLFVFGCFVGLRYSDYSDVKPENIVKIDGEHFIKLITQKTKELVIIPCSPIVLQIFDKYKKNPNRLPRSISNQKFNDYVKEACEKAKLDEIGRLSTDPKKALWECVTSHTARRSFATNYYLQGFPTIDLMKITGHRTEKSFLKYIRVSKLDTAKRLSEHIKKNWSQKMLKIA
ncbi:MAG TPA: site-specific integrase [Puia sp.]|nr:site-specific integrase [Puia sp.]